MPGTRITEKKCIDIGCCVDHPVYLKWLNKLGGYGYWLFEFNHALDDQNETVDRFAPFVEELSTAKGWLKVLGKRSIPKMVIGASNIPVDKIEGLRGLLHSVSVEVLLNPPTPEEVDAWIADGTKMPWQVDGAKWVTVEVQPNTFRIKEARQVVASVELVIVLPEISIQHQ